MHYASGNSGVMSIRDNGVGIPASFTGGAGGVGLLTMKSRAEVLSGKIEIRAAPEGGTVVECSFPLDPLTVDSDGRCWSKQTAGLLGGRPPSRQGMARPPDQPATRSRSLRSGSRRAMWTWSAKEWIGRSFIPQAFATAKPVIACRVGGIPEIVADEKNGLLVAPGNIPELSAAMVRLANRRELRRQLGKAGLELARRELSFETYPGSPACGVALRVRP